MTTTIAPPVRHGRPELTEHLSELGVRRNGVLLVHASMRAVGPVSGGAETVVAALRDVLGAHGTLVVPAFTPENSDTSPQYQDRVRSLTDHAREAVRASMPPFDPATTAAPSMGRLAETVRLSPGAVRSNHPQTSFAALGPLAEELAAHHRSSCHLGEDSPLAFLYEVRAQVLLLGTGFDSCTAFHLGEYRVPAPPRRTYRCVVTTRGRRHWWEYEDVDLDDSDFATLGAEFARTDDGAAIRSGSVGSAIGRLFAFTDAVDFATRRLPSLRA